MTEQWQKENGLGEKDYTETTIDQNFTLYMRVQLPITFQRDMLFIINIEYMYEFVHSNTYLTSLLFSLVVLKN